MSDKTREAAAEVAARWLAVAGRAEEMADHYRQGGLGAAPRWRFDTALREADVTTDAYEEL